jgi:HTH-type transcriptional regulator / antitoxin HigA
MIRAISESYFALVRRCSLKPIRTRREYNSALSMIRELLLRPEGDLDRGEQDYLAAISRFVSDWEAEHLRIDLSGLRPVDALKHLLEAHDMNTADLGRLLGSQSAASMVLTGRRELSKLHVVKLARYFGVDAGLFLGITTNASSGLTRAV